MLTCEAEVCEGHVSSFLNGCLQMTNEVMSKAGIPVVSTWNDTLPLWEFHRDNGHGLECTHFCAPSAPQLWLYLLYENLEQLRREKQIQTL